jgi:hypothetical protein
VNDRFLPGERATFTPTSSAITLTVPSNLGLPKGTEIEVTTAPGIALNVVSGTNVAVKKQPDGTWRISVYDDLDDHREIYAEAQGEDDRDAVDDEAADWLAADDQPRW